jgi:hypothetical protein
MDPPALEIEAVIKGGDMADEIKKEEKKPDGGKVFATFCKVVLGLAFLVVGAYAINRWFGNLAFIIKGCVGLFFLLAGLITLAIAKE